MAHLLEHMLFKGTPINPDAKSALQDRGAFFNATTWYDRTNYYETVPTSALDLALFLDLASRAGMSGIQEWLSFYFKSPQVAAGLYPEHDLFIQHTKLKNTLRWLMGEEQITHLGTEYYD